MNTNTQISRIKQKIDTSNNWEKNNPILLKGEIGIDSTNKKFKIGNGKTNWNNLSFEFKEVDNILDSQGIGSLTQKFDGDSILNFTNKNTALTEENIKNYFGTNADISKLPRGGTGNYAVSFGGKSIAKGKRSIAQGTTTIAIGAYSHAEGDNSITLGDDSHAEGYATSAEGSASHSEGGDTHAKGSHSHTEGGETKTGSAADYAHAEGLKTEANGSYSHSEGNGSKAEGATSHAEGMETIASGATSHSEGYKTKASAQGAHAEGGSTIASADFAHAEGDNTEATSFRSHAEGSSTKTGALVDLTQTPTEPDISSSGDDSSSSSSSDSSSTEVTIVKGASHSEGYRTSAYGWGSHSEGHGTIAYHHYSHAEGEYSNAYGESSHVEGLNTETGDKNTFKGGIAAHAEGANTKATGNYSHAEGNESIASGEGAHAEGTHTTANGKYSHSQNKNTEAAGDYSFAIGDNCVASGASSFSGGNQSYAKKANSFAFGENSVADRENSIALAGGITNSSTKFAVGDYLKIDNSDNLYIKGEIQKVCNIQNKENETFFAYVPFRQYANGSILLNIKQSGVGKKYNALIEIAINTIDSGFHSIDGFVFRQIAGDSIVSSLLKCYIDGEYRISFSITPDSVYNQISITKISDDFLYPITFYSNGKTSNPVVNNSSTTIKNCEMIDNLNITGAKKSNTFTIGISAGYNITKNNVDYYIEGEKTESSGQLYLKGKIDASIINNFIKTQGDIGCEIHFLEGTYTLTEPIKINSLDFAEGANIKISGVGPATRIRYFPSNTLTSPEAAFEIDGTNVIIENMTILAPSSKTDKQYHNGIILQTDASKITIQNCYFKSIGGSCIVFGDNDIENFSIDNSNFKGNNIQILNNTMEEFNYNGIYVRSAVNQVHVINNILEGKTSSYDGVAGITLNLVNNTSQLKYWIIQNNNINTTTYSIRPLRGTFFNSSITNNFSTKEINRSEIMPLYNDSGNNHIF